MANREGLIDDCRLAKKAISDATEIDAQLAEQHREIEIVTELSRKAISENARTAQDQTKFNTRNDDYLERHHQATARIDELEAERCERLAKGKMLDRFIKDIKTGPLILPEFDETLWLTTVENLTVCANSKMIFTFRNGTEIQV